MAGSDPGARIVLFTDDPATLTDQLVAAAGGVPTDVVRSGGAGATTTDGVLRVHHVNHPLQFVDGLAAELTGQYRLEVTLPEPAPEAVTVRLDAGGLAFEVPLTLLTATHRRPPPPHAQPDGRGGVAVASLALRRGIPRRRPRAHRRR